MGTRAVIGGLLGVAAIVAIALPGGATGDDESEPYPTRQVSIMAPAAPGGGWDSTARAFQAASRDAKLDDGVEVYNVEGAGGTLGLSEHVSKNSGDPYELMMTGLVMLGAIETNQSDVPLDATTPIATMITEAEAIVVPAKSEYQTLKDLADDLESDPGSVRVGGGSAGSTDQLLLGELTAHARRRSVPDPLRRPLRRRRGQHRDPLRLGRRRHHRAVRGRRPGRGRQDAPARRLHARSTSRSTAASRRRSRTRGSTSR